MIIVFDDHVNWSLTVPVKRLNNLYYILKKCFLMHLNVAFCVFVSSHPPDSAGDAVGIGA